MRRLLLVSLLAFSALARLAAQEAPVVVDLPQRHREWLVEVAPLLSPAEQAIFVGLSKDYQRDAFIDRFWRARDPFPETSRNEFRDRWQANLQLARELYPLGADARARMLLFNGEPADKRPIQCADYLKPLEVWYYEGTPQIRGSFYLVFFRQGAGRDRPYELWIPSKGLYPLLTPTFQRPASDQETLSRIADACVTGGQLTEALTRALDWEELTDRIDVVPTPGDEWLRTFVAYSTDLPEGAATFNAKVEIAFPGRYQSRTLVQGLVGVPIAEALLSDVESRPSYNFVLDGEILLKGELFEHFRYRFNLSAGQAQGDQLPLAFQRYLRPGSYELVLKVEDLNRPAFFRATVPLEVPQVTAPPPEVTAAAEPVEPAPDARALSTRLLKEANADLPTGDVTMRLLAPRDSLVVGRVRVEAMIEGEGVGRVTFFLNGKEVFRKSRPPFSVELGLGDAPRTHLLRAVAEGAAGQLLAADEVLLNAGPHRFAVRLIEPQAGRRYAESLRAQVVVDVPEGEQLDRVEVFLNDTLVATLYQPPFVQPLFIPQEEPLSYVRTVAHLVGGGTAEDAVFVNAPDYVDEVDVQFVELYSTVLGRMGRPVEDLRVAEVVVKENGVAQTIRRFERVTDVPIHAGILLDVSASMQQRLEKAVEGALRFFETVLTPRDRAAVITFNEHPHLAVRFTNSLEVLAGGLSGLVAEGDTALYDSLIYSLYYFSGISGKRAIILLSDGEDVRSHYLFEDAIEYARRSGVAIYTVGISLGGGKNEVRIKLQRLASETGGSSFFIEGGWELARVYEAIQQELRSQYVISYQSATEGSGFRKVELEVTRPGVTAKAISGYYP